MIAGGRPNLIGISGKMGSGKDTLSIVMNYIADDNAPDSIGRWTQDVDDFAYKNKKYSEKLKYMVCFLIGCSRSDLEDREFKEKELGEEWDGLTPRKLLQLLGTEAGRQIIHPNIWVNALFADHENNKSEWLSATNSKWIVTDVRFPNEANIIKEKGGIMIRINRPQYLDNGLVIRKNEHLSETSLDEYDKFDYVIENDGTVQDLIDKVKSLNIVERIL